MKHVGLIGYPVAHSLSPRMHNAALNKLRLDARYELWGTPADRLVERIAGLRESEVLGANVTIPYKETVLPLLDEIDPQARLIGAVNTIVNQQGRLMGYNTDAPGFLRALREGAGPDFELRGAQIVLLGSGGAARGAATALLDSQVGLLTILARTPAHLEGLLALLRQQSHGVRVKGAIFGTPQARYALAQAQVVVNATSVGLKVNDRTALIEIERLSAKTLVMDMIFNPPQTPLLQAAKAQGYATLNGLSMLLYQGTLAFELWTGRPAPEDIMRAALKIV